MKRLLAAGCLMILVTLSANAQDKEFVFSQIADGVFSDGSYYKSTLMIVPWFDTTTPTCSFRFYGLNVTLGAGTGNSFTVNFTAGGFYIRQTLADQAFDSGYLTLSCSDYVFAQVLYGFYAPNGQKLSEATVFGTDGDYNYKLFFNQTEGSQLGVAIANNTDLARNYRLTVGTRTATVSIPARTSLAKFVGDLLTGLPQTGILEIESVDFTQFDAIGLRYTGTVFTTIPAN